MQSWRNSSRHSSPMTPDMRPFPKKEDLSYTVIKKEPSKKVQVDALGNRLTSIEVNKTPPPRKIKKSQIFTIQPEKSLDEQKKIADRADKFKKLMDFASVRALPKHNYHTTHTFLTRPKKQELQAAVRNSEATLFKLLEQTDQVRNRVRFASKRD